MAKSRSLWSDAFRRLRKNRLALFGGGVLCLLCFVSVVTPWVAPYAYDAQNLDLGASPPSLKHWLGTDLLGRDLLTRVLYGGRVSMMVSFAAVSVSLLIGVLWGTIAGFVGGRC